MPQSAINFNRTTRSIVVKIRSVWFSFELADLCSIAPEESIYNEFENKRAQILMKKTPEQTRDIIRWGHQHRRMLREKYRRQFVAYSATRLLAAGRDWDLVEALADAEGEPYLVKWIPAQTSEFQFFWFNIESIQAEERIEFKWRGNLDLTIYRKSVTS